MKMSPLATNLPFSYGYTERKMQLKIKISLCLACSLSSLSIWISEKLIMWQ